MIIRLNGEAREIAARTLDALVIELDLPGEAVATAVNQEFVPRGERAETTITAGDAVEILSPMQGG
jgi:sulfur carrier protein